MGIGPDFTAAVRGVPRATVGPMLKPTLLMPYVRRKVTPTQSANRATDMKVPPTTDPRWNDFVQGRREYPLKCLASRIMYGQVKLVAQRDTAQAIRLAYEYFQKNEALAADDLRVVFELGNNG